MNFESPTLARASWVGARGEPVAPLAPRPIRQAAQTKRMSLDVPVGSAASSY